MRKAHFPMRTLSFILGLLAGTLCWAQGNVDTRIAVNDATDDNTFVVIISNENYKHEEPVPFAKNDGEVFRAYCQKTLGIPASHIRFSPDATLNEINYEIDWLDQALQAYDGEARAIFYYTGHGMPDEANGEAYLLPVDGYSKSSASAVSTKTLYKKLGQMPSSSIMVFLDACFSGAKRDGKMLASSRGVAIKAKPESVGKNVVVFSAAQGEETAYPYKEMRHGLFTYYVLEKLQQSGGHVTLGDLSDYVTQKVKRKSITENGKSQTPSVVAAAGNNQWRKWLMASKAAKKYEEREAAATPAPKQKDTPAPAPPKNRAPIAEPLPNNAPIAVTPPATPPVDTSPEASTLVRKGIKQMKAMHYEEARKFFVQAAGQGSADAEYQLGLLYCNSNYDGYDREAATAHFMKAANANHVEAMYQTGMMHVGVDNAVAKQWLRKAADNGHKRAQAQLNTLK